MPLAGGCQPSSPVKIKKLCVPTRLFLPTPTQYPRPTPHEKSEIWPRRIRDLSTKIQYMGTHPEGHRPTVRRTLVTLSTLRSVGECLRGRQQFMSRSTCASSAALLVSRGSPSFRRIPQTRCADDTTHDLGRRRKLYGLVLLSLPVGRGGAALGKHRRRARLQSHRARGL